MMDLNVRQQTAVDAMRRGNLATIIRGESVNLDKETYPAAMLDRLVSMGLAIRGGNNEHRFWKHK